MNIVEKILARNSGKSSVSPDDVVFANVDKVMMHDVSGPGVIKVFDKLKKQGISVDKLWDPTKVWVAEDHFVPSAEKMSAENIVKLTNFTKNYGIEKHFKYGMGQYGICHTISHEEAMVMPGDVYVGGDSHTNTTGALGAFACGLGHTDIAYVLLNGKIWFKVPETGGNYRTMQFGGSGIDEMSVESRLTLCNMTTEAGAKNGIVEPDQKVVDYLSQRGATDFNLVKGDEDAEYAKVYEYEASEMEPTVAKPFSPENISVVREAPSVELDKSYIGSCTGAKYEDLVAAASVLKGRKVKIRTEILPAAISIYQRAMENGLLKIFLDAGVTVGPPTCGACCGAHMGVLAKDEICISTTNRNFPGRMGHVESQTYLSSPLVAAASAVTGKITDPRDL
jgi:3-isopropylmalate/(R)-2-methylmalate dehydratase large subunit